MRKIARHRSINWSLILEWGTLTALLAGMALFAAWPALSPARAGPSRTLIIYGFSILEDVMNEAVFPAFASHWQASTGEQVQFISSFAGSGTITNQITLGVPAQVAILSTELDALRLVESGALPGPTWMDLPHAGVLNRTPFIIVVRRGNPKDIHDYADLARPGVGVVHPDPLTSGGAQWAILAEYGSAWLATRDERAAYQSLLGIWKNVVAQAASARAARTQFESGFGDALITYEQEPLHDRALGRLTSEVVYPPSTILSEHIVVVLPDNVSPDERDLVNAFVAFLWGDEAQRLFVEYGFRSVEDSLNAAGAGFGTIARPFTVANLGGWPVAKAEIIDRIWRDGVLRELSH